MKVWFILPFFLLLAPSDSYSQNALWMHTFRGVPNQTSVAASGIYGTTHYATGSYTGFYGQTLFSFVSKGGQDIYVRYHTSSGPGTGVSFGGLADDSAACIAVDQSNGQCYVAGYFTDSADFDTDHKISRGGKDGFIMRLNVSGDIQWIKTFGGLGNDAGLSVSISGTSLILTGYYSDSLYYDGQNTNTVSNGMTDVFVMKLDKASGQSQWITSAGGAGFDEGKSSSVNPGGDIFITGIYSATSIFDQDTLQALGGTDVFVSKYTSSGTSVFLKSFGGAGNDDAHRIYCPATGSAFAITGDFRDTAYFDTTICISKGGSDLYIAYCNQSDGNILWCKSGGGTGEDHGYGLVIDNTNIYLAGDFTDSLHLLTSTLASVGLQDLFVSKLDLTGNLTWSKRPFFAPGNDAGYYLHANTSNIYVAGHYTDTIFGGNGAVGGFYGKTSMIMTFPKSTGNANALIDVASFSTGSLHKIESDLNGNSYLLGEGQGIFTYDSMELRPAEAGAVFLLKTDDAGTPLWFRQIDHPTNELTYFYRCAVGSNGQVVTIGTYETQITVGSQTLSSGGAPTAFIICHDSTGNLVWMRNLFTCGLMGASFYVNDLELDLNGNFFVSGYFDTNPLNYYSGNLFPNSSGDPSGFIMKLDPAGTLLWAQNYKVTLNTGFVSCYGLAVDSSNHVYVTGGYWGNGIQQLNFPAPAFNRTSSFILKLDPLGNIVWTKLMASCLSSPLMLFTDDNIVLMPGNKLCWESTFEDSIRFSPQISLSHPPFTRAGFFSVLDESGQFWWAIKVSTTSGYVGAGQLDINDHGEIILGRAEMGSVYIGNDTFVCPPGALYSSVYKFRSDGSFFQRYVINTAGKAAITDIDANHGSVRILGESGRPGCVIGNVYIPSENLVGTTPPFPTIFFTGYSDSCITASFYYSINSGAFYFHGPLQSVNSWYWDFGDGNTDTIANPTHTYANPGTYNVCLIVNTICGPDTLCQPLNFMITGSDTEIQAGNWNVYPNPAHDELIISGKTMDRALKLEMYNVTAQLVLNIEINSGVTRLDVSALAPGAYFYRVSEATTVLSYGKWIKQ